ncbi:MAG: TIGR04211 family SH3 domain-containing protein [Thiotrichales bacterium]|nr:TIGR04211 family SH3 domain-containing protein [Thiotrichales bacterium]
MTKLAHSKPSPRSGTQIFAILLLSGSLGLAVSPIVQAQPSGYTNYITDDIDVPVRRGAGYKFKISQLLPSGTAVRILEVNQDGWANIEYSKGSTTSTGWIETSMLQNQPIAKLRLQEQIEKTNKVEEKFNSLQLELSTLKERFETASNELGSVKQEKFELSQELEHLKSISTNAVALDEENKAMKLRLSEIESQNAIMSEQIDQSEDSVKRQWFLTGGGVLLLGLLLGRFFRLPTKRKRWGEI